MKTRLDGFDKQAQNRATSVSLCTATRMSTQEGLVTVHVNGFRIARLSFLVEVHADPLSSGPVHAQEKRYRTAFASYASEDRDGVLARVQGIQKAVPGLDVFLDVVKLRSGDFWQQRLRQEIVTRDVMYLFWSEAASHSKWVEWEWRCGLDERGINFIDPVPLVSPEEVPPPEELANILHFGDWVLAYMSCTRHSSQASGKL